MEPIGRSEVEHGIAETTGVGQGPQVSIVVLTWDQLQLTQACVESIRLATDVTYELIVVDNGSGPEARAYAETVADVAVCNDSNRGFARGNNQGLARASGELVMFLNNDTVLPRGWTRLIDTLKSTGAGIVVPALTSAGTRLTVREREGDHVGPVNPFGPVPSGVCYLLRTDLMRAIGGWNEDYPVASGEDLDLAFTVWVNDLEIVLDERVLVQHVGHGTSDTKLDNREKLWKENHARFLARWQDLDAEVPCIESCDPDRFERNRRIAAAAVSWRDRYQRHRDRLAVVTSERDDAIRRLGKAASEPDQGASTVRRTRMPVARLDRSLRRWVRRRS